VKRRLKRQWQNIGRQITVNAANNQLEARSQDAHFMFFYLIAQLMILMLTHQLVLSVGLKTAQTLVCSILCELQKLCKLCICLTICNNWSWHLRTWQVVGETAEEIQYTKRLTKWQPKPWTPDCISRLCESDFCIVRWADQVTQLCKTRNSNLTNLVRLCVEMALPLK
jgi:hypothetical protein